MSRKTGVILSMADEEKAKRIAEYEERIRAGVNSTLASILRMRIARLKGVAYNGSEVKPRNVDWAREVRTFLYGNPGFYTIEETAQALGKKKGRKMIPQFVRLIAARLASLHEKGVVGRYQKGKQTWYAKAEYFEEDLVTVRKEYRVLRPSR